MEQIETNSTNEQPQKRTHEGPARLASQLAEIDFEDSRSVISGNEYTTKLHGEEGVGWEKVRPEPASTSEERMRQAEDRRLGREVIQIVVTPDGDRHRQEKFPTEV